MTTYRMTLGAQTIESADPGAKPILEAAKARMGTVPNMYARMANLPALLATYVQAQDAFRGQCGFTPQEQEVVLLTISRENGCNYCMGAHSMIAEKLSKVPAEALEAVRAGSAIPDRKLAALADFAKAMVRTRGNPSLDEAQAFLRAGYGEQHILAVILAIAVKTISNYSNHLFHTPLDAAFARYEWKAQALRD